MAEITRRDIMLLLVMALAIVSMSLVFPSLGLTTEDSVSASEIPEFSLQENRFDIAGDFPNNPGTPTSGTLTYDPQSDYNNNQIWLSGGTDGGGYELVLLPNGTGADVRINEWNSTSFVDEQHVVVSESSPTGVVSNDQWTVTAEITDEFNGTTNTSTGYYQVSYEVVEQPGDGGAIGERIPIVGSLFSAANGLAGMVGWIGSIIYWFIQTTFEVILNVTGMLYDVTSYFIGLLTWMSTTYGAVVTSASGWVSVFVALPGIIFSAVLGKLVIIGIGLLPTT